VQAARITNRNLDRERTSHHATQPTEHDHRRVPYVLETYSDHCESVNHPFLSGIVLHDPHPLHHVHCVSNGLSVLAAQLITTNSPVHLVLHGDSDSCDVLGRVTNDRKDDETDKGLTDRRMLDHRLNGVAHKVCTDSNKAGTDEKHENGRLDRHVGSVVIIV